MRVGKQVTREHVSGPDSSFGTSLYYCYIFQDLLEKKRTKHNIIN